MVVSRIMALDVGEARVGVAISDALGFSAQPIATIRRAGLAPDLTKVADLVREHDVATIVVGLPLKLDGEAGPAAASILTFVEKLQRKVDIPVVTFDERFSTVQAERALLEGNVSRRRRRDAIDKVAAAIILQAYLDSRPRTAPLEEAP